MNSWEQIIVGREGGGDKEGVGRKGERDQERQTDHQTDRQIEEHRNRVKDTDRQ